METHDQDPTTNPNGEPGGDPGGDPWDAVTSEFGSLTDRIKSTYRKVASDRGPSEDEIKDAFSTLLGAWDQVAESVSSALQDPATRDHLKQAASSFASALGETMSGLGEEIKKGPEGWSKFSYGAGNETVDESGSGGGVVNGDGETTAGPEDHL